MNRALRLTTPIEKEYRLDKTDELYGQGETHTVVTIRQARRQATERREALFDQVKRSYNDAHPGEVTVTQDFSFTEMHRVEAFLTLVSSNLEAPDGSLLFAPEVLADEAKFRAAWGSLPDEIADEIHDKIIDLNLSWRPRGK